MTGTIYLNFVGKNPCLTPKDNVPGTVKIFNGKENMMRLDLSMMHSKKCTDNPNSTRIEGMTQPWLGDNVYAEKRQVPVIPWNPDGPTGGRAKISQDKEALNQQQKEEDIQ